MRAAKTPCVCTTLRMATRVVARGYDRALAGVGLRAAGYSLLQRLREQSPLTVGELAGRLALDRTTCSRELQPLVEEGLVEIVAAAGDRRQRLVSLTAAGNERLELARPLWAEAQRAVASSFGESRTERLLEELRELLSTREAA